MSKLITLIALVICFASACAAEDNKALGSDAANSGRYAAAYRLWLPLAEKGDREVQEAVALLLISEQDVGVDFSQTEREGLALKWLGKAALNGQPSAMTTLAKMYEYGWHDLPKNNTASACWFKASKASVKASDCAQFLPVGKKP